MGKRRGIGRLVRAARSAVARRDWVGALGALSTAEPRLARQWLRLRGARGPVPAGAAGEERRAAAAAAVDAAEEALRRARQRAAAIATWAPDAWHDHRRDNPVPPPPGDAVPVAVILDACGAAPADLRATLLSLVEQAHGDWTARVIADEGMAGHPVASLATIDPRIGFGGAFPDRPTILVDAGTLLDRHALGWLGFTLARTGAAAAYADDDRLADDPRFGRRWSDPALRGVFDADMAAVAEPPAVVLIADARGAADAVERLGGREARRSLLLAAGRVAHVPQPLASRLLPTVATRRAPADADTPPPPARPAPIPAAPAAIRPLRIVMPTRDEPELVRDAVETLLDRAEDAARLHLIVVDNRSTQPATATLLDRLRRERGIEVRAHDEPFNWSRINNLAVVDGDEPDLLFVNNDTRMLTPGWDRLLSAALARPDVGAAGARLLYPDGALQHVGIVLGVGRSPIHEGVGAAGDDPGPLGRWHVTRAVAAVTGAFLGTPRDAFTQAGGFDEARLAVGYNDVDLCLAVRALGRRVLFVPGIELVHFESRTRGHNVAKSRVAWDEGELASLRDRWGDALDLDPGYNPRWARCERPFDGFRVPADAETLAWIDRSAAADPWRVSSG